jgi:regulator of sigma D
MHFKEGQYRGQMMMVSYETMILPDNPVRLIDLLCRKFIADNPWRQEWKGKEGKGRKSYPPVSMLGMLVYGYFNGISSSRKLERETFRNIELLWLMEGLQPDHWTICEFRRDNVQLVKDVLKTFRRFLLDEEYASGKKLVFDGSKIKAYASRDMLNSEGIRHKLENLDKSIAEYLSQLEDNDSNEDALETAQQEIKQLKEKVAKLEAQKAKLETVAKTLEASGKRQISPNDTDAVLVKGRDGKFPGYNAQTGVEAKGHFIMYNEVTTDAVDQQQLASCVENATMETEIIPEEILADKGYGNTTQILEIESNGIQCFIPLATTSREKEEKQDLVFKYDKESDTCICPQGKKLYLFSKKNKHHGAIYNTYKCKECDGCPILMNCTKSKTGRIYKRNIEQERIDQYKEKLKTNYAKEKIAERKSIVEHPFGTIKWLMGKFQFLLTGKEKVQTEFNLYTTAYNIKRLINCDSTTELMGKMMRYNWAVA